MGEEIIIANRGVPVARLSPAAREKPKRNQVTWPARFGLPTISALH